MPNMRCHMNLHRHWQLDTFCTAQQTFWITSHTRSDDTAAEVPWYTAQPLLKARSALIMVLLCDKHLRIVRHLCTGAIAVGIATRSQHTATFMHNVAYTPHAGAAQWLLHFAYHARCCDITSQSNKPPRRQETAITIQQLWHRVYTTSCTNA